MSKDAPCAITNAFPTDDTIFLNSLYINKCLFSFSRIKKWRTLQSLKKFICTQSNPFVRYIFGAFLDVKYMPWRWANILNSYPMKKELFVELQYSFYFQINNNNKKVGFITRHCWLILCSLIFSEKIDQNALSIPFIKTKCLPFSWSLSSVPFDHTNTQKNFEDMFSYSLECASMCVLPKNLNNDLFHVSDSWQWQCVKWTFWSRNRDHSSANIACSHLFT